MEIKTVGLIGSSPDVAQLAQLIACSGRQALLVSPYKERLEQTIQLIRSRLESEALGQGNLVSEWERYQSRIKLALDMKALHAVDMVIEMELSKIELKQRLFQEIHPIVNPRVIFATPFDQTEQGPQLATQCGRPERFVQLQFLPHLPQADWIELHAYFCNNPEVIDDVSRFFSALGLLAVVHRGEARGSLYESGILPLLHHVLWLMYDNRLTAEQVDHFFTVGFKQKRGILSFIDLYGLDFALKDLEQTWGAKAVCPILKQIVQAGWLGKKSGRGFFSYPDSTPSTLAEQETAA